MSAGSDVSTGLWSIWSLQSAKLLVTSTAETESDHVGFLLFTEYQMRGGNAKFGGDRAKVLSMGHRALLLLQKAMGMCVCILGKVVLT